ncbi:hypothetical protein HDU96_001454, partial [Phlyctochytrium bullatum]
PRPSHGKYRISLLDLGNRFTPEQFASAARLTNSIPPGTNINRFTQLLVAEEVARRRFNRNGDLSVEELLVSITEQSSEAHYFNNLIPECLRYAEFELRLSDLNEFHPVEYADDLEELNGSIGRLRADIRNQLWQLIKQAIDHRNKAGNPYGSLVLKLFDKGANSCSNGNLSYLAGEVLPDWDATIRSEVQKRVTGKTSDEHFQRVCRRFFDTPQPSEPFALGLSWSIPRSIDVVDGAGNIRSFCRSFIPKTKIDPGHSRVADEPGPSTYKRPRQAKALPYGRDRDGDVIFVDTDDTHSVRSEGSNLTTATATSSTASLRAAVSGLDLKQDKGKEKGILELADLPSVAFGAKPPFFLIQQLVPHHRQLAAAAASAPLPRHLKEKFAKRPADEELPRPEPLATASTSAPDTGAKTDAKARPSSREKRSKKQTAPGSRRSSRGTKTAAPKDPATGAVASIEASATSRDHADLSVPTVNPGSPSADTSSPSASGIKEVSPPPTSTAAEPPSQVSSPDLGLKDLLEF